MTERDLIRKLSIDRSRQTPMRFRAIWLLAGAIALVVVAGIAGRTLWADRSESIPSKLTNPLPAPPGEPNLETVTAPGFVVARRRATVAAEVTGRLVEVHVEEGQPVRRGQLLAVLDAGLAQADLEAARAQVGAAAANIDRRAAALREARLALERSLQLNERGFASPVATSAARAELETSEADLAEARAQHVAALQEVRSQEAHLARYSIRAPFDGVIIDRTAQAGEIISPASAGGAFTRTGICTIVDMDELEVELEISEARIGRIRPGLAAEVVLDAHPDKRLPGEVIAVIPTARRDTGTVRTRVRFIDAERLALPDMSTKVTIALGPPLPTPEN